MTLDKFTQGYIEAALWSSSDDDGEPLDHKDADLAPDTYKRFLADCDAFQKANQSLIDLYCDARGYDESYAGHDFWLTRNGHGVGFWDRDLGELGDMLTAKAKTYGQCDLYIGDDGLIHA